jgi:hypothetical protein
VPAKKMLWHETQGYPGRMVAPAMAFDILLLVHTGV